MVQLVVCANLHVVEVVDNLRPNNLASDALLDLVCCGKVGSMDLHFSRDWESRLLQVKQSINSWYCWHSKCCHHSIWACPLDIACSPPSLVRCSP